MKSSFSYLPELTSLYIWCIYPDSNPFISFLERGFPPNPPKKGSMSPKRQGQTHACAMLQNGCLSYMSRVMVMSRTGRNWTNVFGRWSRSISRALPILCIYGLENLEDNFNPQLLLTYPGLASKAVYVVLQGWVQMSL